MNDYILTTSNFNTVEALCNEALSKSKFISIVGYPGAGKTTALKAFANNKQNVFYVRATASMPAREFYSKLLQAMGVEGKESGVSLHDLISNISFRLNFNSIRKLIIMDEAGKFKPKFLEYIHELRDNTEATTGIIFAGPQYFKDNIEKWVNKGIVGIPEVYRRINHWEELSPIQKTEVRAIANHFGINDESFITRVFKTSENFAEVRYRIDEHLYKQSFIE